MFSRHAAFNFDEFLLKSFKGFFIDLELCVAISSMIDVVSERHWLSNNRFNLKNFLVILGKNIDNFDYLHICVIKRTRILLFPKSIPFTMLVDLLVYSELLNLSLSLLDLMPYNIAPSTLHPSLRPCCKILFNF